MNKVRKLAENPLVMFPIVACFMFTSCKKTVFSDQNNNHNGSISMSKSSQQYTGQQFYEGIFLRQGTIVNQLPVFQGKSTLETLNITPTESLQIIAAGDSIIAKVHELNSTYFNDLAAAIYSNDHIEIKEKIKLGAALTLSAIEEIEAFSFAQELISNTALQEELINRIGEDDFEDLLANPTRERMAEIQMLIGDLSELDISMSNGQCLVFGVVLVVGVVVLAAAAVGVVAVAAGEIVAVNELAVANGTETETSAGGTEEGGTEAGGGTVVPPNGNLVYEQLVQDLVDSF